VTSTYTFGDAASLYRDLRAGDDIIVRHTETGDDAQLASHSRMSPRALTDLDTGAAMVASVELDDCVTSDVARVASRPNDGSITDTEPSATCSSATSTRPRAT